jgi:hypothetical protein
VRQRPQGEACARAHWHALYLPQFGEKVETTAIITNGALALMRQQSWSDTGRAHLRTRHSQSPMCPPDTHAAHDSACHVHRWRGDQPRSECGRCIPEARLRPAAHPTRPCRLGADERGTLTGNACCSCCLCGCFDCIEQLRTVEVGWICIGFAGPEAVHKSSWVTYRYATRRDAAPVSARPPPLCARRRVLARHVQLSRPHTYIDASRYL